MPLACVPMGPLPMMIFEAVLSSAETSEPGNPSVPGDDALPKSITVLAVSGAMEMVPPLAAKEFEPASVMSSLASASVGAVVVA